MRYKLRVHLGEEVILERLVKADCVETQYSAEGSFQSVRLGPGSRIDVVALRYGVDDGSAWGTVTQADCLVTLEEIPEND